MRPVSVPAAGPPSSFRKKNALPAGATAPGRAESERILRFCPSRRPQQFAQATIGNALQPIPRHWPLPGEALRSMDFIMACDSMMNPTVEGADIVLPATTWIERDEVTAHRQASISEIQLGRAVLSHGETKQNVNIVMDNEHCAPHVGSGHWLSFPTFLPRLGKTARSDGWKKMPPSPAEGETFS